MRQKYRDLKVGFKHLLAFAVIMVLGLIGFVRMMGVMNRYVAVMTGDLAKAHEASNLVRMAALENSNMARETQGYIYTREDHYRVDKLKADANCASVLDKAAGIIKQLPDNEELLKAHATVETADETFCDPVENKVLGLVQQNKIKEAERVFKETLAPGREKLQTAVAGFMQKTDGYVNRLERESSSTAVSAVRFGWVIQALILLVSALISWALARSMTTSLNRLMGGLKEVEETDLAQLHAGVSALAQGDLRVAVSSSSSALVVTSKDEFGAMTTTFNHVQLKVVETLNAFQATQESLKQLIGQVASSSQEVSERGAQLAHSAQLSRDSAGTLGASFQMIADSTKQAADTSQELAMGGEQQAHQSTYASAAMQRLYSAIQVVQEAGERQQAETYRAEEQMEHASGAVQQVQVSVQQMASAAQQAAAIAQSGGTSVGRTISSMKQIQEQVQASTERIHALGEKGKEIGVIVETIRQIAEQTNLLALNAAIEAARAGEHGKGFAVVADEVRKLAERSAQATREIGSLVKGVREEVNAAVETMSSSNKEVSLIADQSQEAVGALEQILKAAEAFAKETEQVNSVAVGMSRAIKTVQQTVESVHNIANKNQTTMLEMSQEAEGVSQNISNVAAFSQEAAAGAEEMSATVQEIAQTSQGVAHTVEEQIAIAEEVSSTADRLQATAEQLRALLGQFQTGGEEQSSKVLSLRKAA